MSEGSIRAIDASSVHQITSGQVITDLATAVKELVENSLDAGATNIEVRFKDYGLTSIEVLDNGSGIDAKDYANVALKGHTSKLASYEDLSEVSSFGFRGEAISSLCQLADVSITTATEQDTPKATILMFDRRGNLRPGKGMSARPRGTTVCITNLFATVPVRRKEFERNSRKQFANAQTVLQAYAIISTGARISLSNQQGKKAPQILFKTDGRRVRDNYAVLYTPKAASSLLDLDLTLTVEAEKRVLRVAGLNELTTEVSLSGLISQPSLESSRTSADRQFFFVNGRPFEGKALAKAFNEIYKNYVPNHYPSVVADFRLATDSYDVNVSPDKRSIFLHSEKNLAALEGFFQPFRSTYSMNALNLTKEGRLQLNSMATLRTLAKSKSSPVSTQQINGAADNVESGTSSPDVRSRTSSVASEDIDKQDISRSRSSTAMQDSINNKDVHFSLPACTDQTESDNEAVVLDEQSDSDIEVSVIQPIRTQTSGLNTKPVKQMTIDTSGAGWNLQPADETQPRRKKPRLGNKDSSNGEQMAIDYFRTFSANGQAAPQPSIGEDVSEGESESGMVEEEEGTISARDSSILREALHEASTEDNAGLALPVPGPSTLFRPPSISPDDATPIDLDNNNLALSPKVDSKVSNDLPDSVAVPLNVAELRQRLSHIRNLMSQSRDETPVPSHTDPGALEAAGIDHAPEEAHKALSRLVSKSDFERMDIVGQFNLAFIIARRRHAITGKGKGKVTDQDAYHDDLMIIDQHASDEKYNFERLQQVTRIESQRLISPRALNLPASDELLAIDHEDVLKFNGFEIEVNEESPIGQRIRLVAMPISKSTKKTEFTFEDFEELLFLLREHTGSDMIRPSKTRKLFAMLACRSSVMVGKNLNNQQMTTIVRHMGTLDQPWNCPHGRNTMRWLAGIEATARDRRQNVSTASLARLAAAIDSPTS